MLYRILALKSHLVPSLILSLAYYSLITVSLCGVPTCSVKGAYPIHTGAQLVSPSVALPAELVLLYC